MIFLASDHFAAKRFSESANAIELTANTSFESMPFSSPAMIKSEIFFDFKALFNKTESSCFSSTTLLPALEEFLPASCLTEDASLNISAKVFVNFSNCFCSDASLIFFCFDSVFCFDFVAGTESFSASESSSIWANSFATL